MNTEKFKTEASSKTKKNKKKTEKKQVAAAKKLKKDKAEESRQENKRTIPKEVPEMEVRDCDQNIAKEKKHEKKILVKNRNFPSEMYFV